MSRSTASRRVREFVGVALFAAALIWIIALASYEPSDPVWFFSTGAHADPVNFAGRVGAFLAELSFQLFGDASYMIPAVLIGLGWQSFWCREVDAAGTKAAGAALLFTCISAFLSLVFGTLEVPANRSARADTGTGSPESCPLYSIEQALSSDSDAHRPGDHHVHAVFVRRFFKPISRIGDGSVRASLIPRMAGPPARETASK